MKKFICVLLILTTLFIMPGCKKEEVPSDEGNYDYSVRSPLSYPDYTFASEPDTNDLRKTAVRAMRDLLSIQWCTPKEIKFKNDGADNKKIFNNLPGRTYGGLPYTLASTGIFHFFEYYDEETGMLLYEGNVDEMKYEIGSACTDSILWSLSTVSNTFNCGYYPTFLVPSNGFIPVGDYIIKENIRSYHEYPTYAIIEANGKEKMLEAYAQTLPADLLISTPDDHALMITQKPVVLHLADGSIDAENSYLMIQDQRVGEYFYEDYGVGVPFYGRLVQQYTFAQLLEAKYIPVTVAEFIGTDPYEKAAVTVSNANCDSISDLSSITVNANYPLVHIKLIGVTKDGTQRSLKRISFNGATTNGVPMIYNMSKAGDLSAYITKDIQGIQLEVVVSTGERFYPLSFDIK